MLTTIRTLKRILFFLEENRGEKLSLRRISEGTKLHYYATKESVEFLGEIGVITVIEDGNAVYARLSNDNNN